MRFTLSFQFTYNLKQLHLYLKKMWNLDKWIEQKLVAVLKILQRSSRLSRAITAKHDLLSGFLELLIRGATGADKKCTVSW